MTNQRINNTEIWRKRKLLYQTAADLFIGFFLKKPTCILYMFVCSFPPGGSAGLIKLIPSISGPSLFTWNHLAFIQLNCDLHFTNYF